MNSTTFDTATPKSLLRQHIVRAAVSVLWAVLLAGSFSVGRTSTSVPAISIALLVAYPVIDVVASLLDVRTRRGTLSTQSVLLVANTVISLVTAVTLGIAAGHSAGAALRVFGIWALLTGLLQLGAALAHRRRERRGQWPMILSGSISAVAGLAFVQMGGRSDPALTVLAGYAVAGAALLLLSVYRLRLPHSAIR